MGAPNDHATPAQFVVEFVSGYLFRLRNVGPSAVHGVVASVGDEEVTPGLPRNVTLPPMGTTEPFFLRRDAGPPAEITVRCDEHPATSVSVPAA